jgi:ribosome-associated protein
LARSKKLTDKLSEHIELILNAAEEKKACDIKWFKVQEKGFMADAYVLLSGTSSTHLSSLANHLARSLSEGKETVRVEGKSERGWMIVATWNVIIHIMSEEMRAHYKLEDLWQNKSHVYHE